MGDKFMKSTSNLAVAIAAGLFMTAAPMSASAADLGGDCCADLEERVAELEATTVRKGNRKVSLKLFGFVHRAIMVWDANDNGVNDNDVYSVSGGTTAGSRFGMKGSASIGGGWSAGFLLEYGVGDTMASSVSQNVDDAEDNLSLRHDVLYLKNKQFGTIYVGHSSTSTDGIAEINLSGTKVATKGSAVQTWNRRFTVNAGGDGGTWSRYVGNLDGGRGDASIRYDTPNMVGFVGSATFGEDDWFDVALRYANEFGGVLRVAAGIGYSVNSGRDNSNDETTTLNGSVSAMHVPTGLNVSFAAGESENDTVIGAKDSYWHVTVGLKQKWTSVGATALYAEYGDYDLNQVREVGGATDVAGDGTTASMWGVGVVQKIDAGAMEIYAAYRSYELDTAAVDNSWSAATLGARIKF